MQKLSLKNVKETLTRKEMRVIAGGYGGTGYGYRCYDSSESCGSGYETGYCSGRSTDDRCVCVTSTSSWLESNCVSNP